VAAQPNPYAAAAAVAGAGLLLYALLSDRSKKKPKTVQRDCDTVGNLRGATPSEPCTSAIGPFGYCSVDDFEAWRNRLSGQTQVVAQLRANLDAAGMLSPDIQAMIDQYLTEANSEINAWSPVLWTDGGDVMPFVGLTQRGCEIINEANRRFVQKGYEHLQVEEGAGVEVEPPKGATGSVLGAGGQTLGVVLLVAGLGFVGWQLYRLNKLV